MGKGKRNREKRPTPKAQLKESIRARKALRSSHEGKVKSLTTKIEADEAKLKDLA